MMKELLAKGLVVICKEVQLSMEDRSIRIGANASGNFNTGDHVAQTINWGIQETQVYEKLLNEIKSIPGLTVDEVQDATEILGDLKKKSEEEALRPSLLKRMWDQLPKAVTLLQSAVEVYKNFSSS